MEFQAALARVQLSKIDENVSARRTNVLELNRLLAQASDDLIFPKYNPEVVNMAYPMILRKGNARTRTIVLSELESRGVECRPLFGCIPTQQPAYAKYKPLYEGLLPVAEEYGAKGFYVGCHQYLDKNDIHYIADAILTTLKGLNHA
jgi:CDP-6-deoxy-D-xylo-4-hexulose-3-dehydrase